MVRQRSDNKTLDIFSDFRPPDVAPAMSDELVRAVSTRAKVSRVVTLMLEDSALTREETAERLSREGDGEASINMLNAYTSQAREDHNIPAFRLIELCGVLDDWRGLNELLKSYGMAVIDQHYLSAVEEAMWAEQEERAKTERMAARRRWKAGAS